jgi:hypothetical protein
MALQTKPDNTNDQVKYDEPPIPIIVRNHILAQTYSTKTTDNKWEKLKDSYCPYTWHQKTYMQSSFLTPK